LHSSAAAALKAPLSACAANAVLVVIPARGGYHLVQTV